MGLPAQSSTQQVGDRAFQGAGRDRKPSTTKGSLKGKSTTRNRQGVDRYVLRPLLLSSQKCRDGRRSRRFDSERGREGESEAAADLEIGSPPVPFLLPPSLSPPPLPSSSSSPSPSETEPDLQILTFFNDPPPPPPPVALLLPPPPPLPLPTTLVPLPLPLPPNQHLDRSTSPSLPAINPNVNLNRLSLPSLDELPTSPVPSQAS